MPSTKRKTDYAVRTIFSADDRLTKQLRSIVGSGVRSIRRLGSAAKTAALGIAGIGAAAGGAAYGTYRLVRATTDSLDTLDEQAHSIGMSAQALLEWQGVAERNGIAADEMVAGLSKMNVAVSGVRNGTGKLTKTLKAHLPGVYAQIKAAKDNEEAQAILFRAIRAVPNEMDRAALASEAFGRSLGPKLLTLLESTDEELATARGRIRALRGEMTPDKLRAASDFNDQIEDVSDAFGGLRDAISLDLIKAAGPALSELTSWLTTERAGIAKEIASGIKEIATELARVDWKGVAGDMLNAAKEMASMLTTAIDAAKLLTGDVSVLGKGSREAGSQGVRPPRLENGRVIAPLSDAPRSAADLSDRYGGQGAPISILQQSGGVSGLIRVVVEAARGTGAEVVATSGRGVQLKAAVANPGARGVGR